MVQILKSGQALEGSHVPPEGPDSWAEMNSGENGLTVNQEHQVAECSG